MPTSRWVINDCCDRCTNSTDFHGDDVAGEERLRWSIIAASESITRSGGTHDQHQTAVRHDDFFENFRQRQRREIGNFSGDGSDHHADLSL